MRQILAENFDFAAPPDLPASVVKVAGSGLLVVQENPAYARSAPASVQINAGQNVTVASAVPDRTDGNCTVRCSILLEGTLAAGGSWYGGVGISVGAPAVWGAPGDLSYRWAIINLASPTRALGFARNAAWVEGNSGAALATGVWYTLVMIRNGPTFWCGCQRSSDGFWLNSSPAWQEGFAAAFTFTDGTPQTAAANHGLFFSHSNPSAAQFYFDDFAVWDESTAFPHVAGVPLKGMEVGPNNVAGMTSGDWGQFWSRFTPTGPGGWQTMIDLALSVNCNFIKASTCLQSYYTRLQTKAQALQKLDTLIAYCKSKNLYYYHSESGLATTNTTQNGLFAAMAADWTDVAGVLAKYNNIIGFDLLNEYNFLPPIEMYTFNGVHSSFAMTAAQYDSWVYTVSWSIRNSYPDLALTMSCGNPNYQPPFFRGGGVPMTCLDFADQHVYYSPAVGYSWAPGDGLSVYPAANALGTNRKPFFISELGYDALNVTTGRGAQLDNIWNQIVLGSYTGTGQYCLGANWFIALNYVSGYIQFPMWDDSDPAVPYADVAVPYAAYAASTYQFVVDPVQSQMTIVWAMRATSNVVVAAGEGDLDTVIGSGFSTKYPFWSTQVPGNVSLLSNGIDPMQRWDAATGVMEVAGVPAPRAAVVLTLAGTTSAQAAGAFIYGFVRFYDNYGNFSDLSPLGQGVSGYSEVTYARYWGVATPTGPSALKVVGRQLLRNTPGQATTFYVDIDTRDLTSQDFLSQNADAFVQTQTAVPLLSTTGGLLANIHGFPPSWKAVTAAYLGRVFAAGEVTYDVGNVVVTAFSRTVQGIGTDWPISFAGRHLFLSNPPGEYEIATVDPVAQVLQLTTAYNGPTDPFAIYGIRAPASEWRNIYYTPVGLPESWPPSYALSLQEDADEITGLMQLGSFLYILERQHIYRLTFLTDPALDGAIFLSSRRGCINQRLWVQAESTAYLFDALGVHSFSGGNSQPISDPIQDLWRDNGDSPLVINWNADTSLWNASYNAAHTTVRFFVAMTGSRYPKHALCYNYRSNRWWIEEYPRPVCATTLMTIQATTRTLAGMDSNTVGALDVGYLDGTRGIVPTITGTVTAQSACSVTDAYAAFTAEVVNLQLAIVHGRAKGQSRRIIAVTAGGTRLALETPWRIAPAPGDAYAVGAIAWSWRPGWFRILDDAEGTSARDVEVLFQPQETGTVDVAMCYNRSADPRTWTSSRDGTATVTAGDPRVEIDLTDPSGRGIFRMEGHRERYLDGDIYLSPQFSGYQYKEPVLIYRITLSGVSKEG